MTDELRGALKQASRYLASCPKFGCITAMDGTMLSLPDLRIIVAAAEREADHRDTKGDEG